MKYVDSTEKSQPVQRILSFCTGAGMLDRGIEAVLGKCEVSAYAEIETYAVAKLLSLMEEEKIHSAKEAALS